MPRFAANLSLRFVLARVLNRHNLDDQGGDDVYWQSEKLARAGRDEEPRG